MTSNVIWAAQIMMPKLSVFFMAVSIVFIIAVVAGTAFFAKKRMKASVKPLFIAVLTDGVGFLISSILFVLCIWMPFFPSANGKETPWRLDMFQQIYFIAVQYLVIYFVFRKFLKNYRTPGNAVMFGAGHALAYSIVILVTNILSLLLSLNGSGDSILRNFGLLTGSMAATGSIRFLAPVLDRALIMPVQILCTLLVYIAARKRKPGLLATAIILNMTSYLPILMFGDEVWFFSYFPVMLITSCLSLAVTVLVTIKQYRKYANNEPDFNVKELNMDLIK